MKKLYIFSFLTLLFLLPAQAITLHVLIFCDNTDLKTGIGNRNAFSHFKREADRIYDQLAYHIPDIKPEYYTGLGNLCSKQYLQQELDRMETEPCDIILVFTSMHGYHPGEGQYPVLTFPQPITHNLDARSLPLLDLYEQLKAKPHRLLFFSNQSCNGYKGKLNCDAPILTSPNPSPLEERHHWRYKELFWDTEGELLLTAAKPDQYAHVDGNGGYFLSSLLEAIARQTDTLRTERASWDELIFDVQQQTSKLASSVDACGPQFPIFKKNLSLVESFSFTEEDCLGRDLPPDMVLVKGDTFTMGCTSEQISGGCAEWQYGPVRKVMLEDFYMDIYEVSVGEFELFVKATGYQTTAEKRGTSFAYTQGYGNWHIGMSWKCDEKGKNRPRSDYDHPVIHVSWFDAVHYANWRSKEKGLTPVYTISGSNVTADRKANGYRLPTEAEWEFAAREGGKRVLFGNGRNVADPSEMNFRSEKRQYDSGIFRIGPWRQRTVPVNSFIPNSLGLYNLAGNVREWCWDWSGRYPAESEVNPWGPVNLNLRVLRGGSWHGLEVWCTVTHRDNATPNHSYADVGFRLVRTP